MDSDIWGHLLLDYLLKTYCVPDTGLVLVLGLAAKSFLLQDLPQRSAAQDPGHNRRSAED